MKPSKYLTKEANKFRVNLQFNKELEEDTFNFSKYEDCRDIPIEKLMLAFIETIQHLKYIKNPTIEIIELACNYSFCSIWYAKDLDLPEDLIEKAIKESPFYFTLVKNINIEFILRYLDIVIDELLCYLNLSTLPKEINLRIIEEIMVMDDYKFCYFVKQKDKFEPEVFSEFIDTIIKIKTEKSRIFILHRFPAKAQCEELCLKALAVQQKEHNDIRIKTKAIALEVLKFNTKYFNYLKKLGMSNIELLKINGMALDKISNPTELEIRTAVMQNGNALKFVKNHTDELCNLAVENTGMALKHIENPTLEMCVKAFINYPLSINYIKDFGFRAKIREGAKESAFKNTEFTNNVLDILETNKKIISTLKKILSSDENLSTGKIIEKCEKALIKKVNEDIDLTTLITKQVKILLNSK